MSEEEKFDNSRNMADDSIDMPQPEIRNEKPETELMEVHHHPNVEKKDFKEYFLRAW